MSKPIFTVDSQRGPIAKMSFQGREFEIEIGPMMGIHSTADLLKQWANLTDSERQDYSIGNRWLKFDSGHLLLGPNFHPCTTYTILKGQKDGGDAGMVNHLDIVLATRHDREDSDFGGNFGIRTDVVFFPGGEAHDWNPSISESAGKEYKPNANLLVPGTVCGCLWAPGLDPATGEPTTAVYPAITYVNSRGRRMVQDIASLLAGVKDGIVANPQYHLTVPKRGEKKSSPDKVTVQLDECHTKVRVVRSAQEQNNGDIWHQVSVSISHILVDEEPTGIHCRREGDKFVLDQGVTALGMAGKGYYHNFRFNSIQFYFLQPKGWDATQPVQWRLPPISHRLLMMKKASVERREQGEVAKAQKAAVTPRKERAPKPVDGTAQKPADNTTPAAAPVAPTAPAASETPATLTDGTTILGAQVQTEKPKKVKKTKAQKPATETPAASDPATPTA